MRGFLTAAAVTLLAAAAVRPLSAQPDVCVQAEAAAGTISTMDRLNLLSRIGCLGGSENDADPLTKSAMRILPAKDADSASRMERRLVVLSALDPVMTATRQQRDQLPEGSPERAMLTALDSSVAFTRAAVATGLIATDHRLLLSLTWTWNINASEFGGLGIPLASTVNEACRDTATESCRSTIRTAEFVLRAAKLVERGLAFHGRSFLTAALAQTTERDARWTAYFDETLVQFPWELWLNSRRFTSTARAQRGFAMPPNDQLVLLHPMAGVEYVWSAPKGSRMTPAVAIEVLGFNRWSWSADSKPARALGASVVAAFSDRAGVDDVGLGVLLRVFHKYSVTVTARSGNTGVLVSSDLGSWVNTRRDAAEQAMRLAGPPP